MITWEPIPDNEDETEELSSAEEEMYQDDDWAERNVYRYGR